MGVLSPRYWPGEADRARGGTGPADRHHATPRSTSRSSLPDGIGDARPVAVNGTPSTTDHDPPVTFLLPPPPSSRRRRAETP